MKVSIVTPAYKCSTCIEELYNRLKIVLEKISNEYEIIFVNDHSPDNDWEIISKLVKIEDSNAIGINLSRNFGHQAAVSAGLDYATGDIIIIMDADLQDPPEVIPEMIKKHQEGYEIVYAVRTERQKETFLKKLSSKLFYRLINKISDIPIPLDSGDFRLLSKKANDELKKLKENNRFIRGLTSWIGFPQAGIEYIREPRFSGESAYTLIKLVKFSIDGITSFTKKPLIFSIFLGFIMSFLGFLYISYAVFIKIIYNVNPTGWTSLIVFIFLTSGIQLMILGVLGTYIGRIYDEVKQRPLYIINEIKKNDEKI